MNEPILPNPRGSSTSPADPAKELPVAGLTAFTTIDFPGRLSAVLYTQGCAWRCRYCHNAHLRPFELPHLHWSDIHAFLTQRTGFLDAVVFSGGEPTAHAVLGSAMLDVRRWGFEVGLHTAGMFPDRLSEALEYCAWVGMDAKAPFDDYEKITGVQDSGRSAHESAALILKSGVEHEFRTTFHSDLLTEAELLEIAGALRAMGAKRYVVQSFRKTGCIDPELQARPGETSAISQKTVEALSRLFPSFVMRD